MTSVVLVDQEDNVLGEMEKMKAHRLGVLHRAVSVIIFNSQGDMLLQKRALTKYHSGGLWSNACCTHPILNESPIEASSRRLIEEMGIEADLSKQYSFVYKVELENKLIEHELDHVFIGTTDQVPQINLEEVCDYRYASITSIMDELNQTPENYSSWFKLIFDELIKQLSEPKAS